MLSTCNNCKEIIRPDNEAPNLFVHTSTNLDGCRTMLYARATLGIRIKEVDDNQILAIGATNTDEALAALNQYRKDIYGDSIGDVRVDNFTLRKEFVREVQAPDADTVKLIVIPDAIDLDGYTPLITFKF